VVAVAGNALTVVRGAANTLPTAHAAGATVLAVRQPVHCMGVTRKRRERERERDGDGERDGEREKEGKGEREREREGGREGGRERERERERERPAQVNPKLLPALDNEGDFVLKSLTLSYAT
jgi:hypothetical protein